jgi:4-amino-4-deoxy-L-arabinose transferase-like glycosyltransferase
MAFKRLFKDAEFWVFMLFILVLAIRLFIAFQTPYFNYEAYFPLRQVESILHTGLPLYNDPLSYGGKTQLFAPLYYYVLALFSLLAPAEIVAKVLPNIFASCIVVLVYMIAIRLTKHQKISLTTSFMSGFIPIMFLDINRATIDYLAILLILGVIYCIFKISERKYVDYALILMFLLVLATPLAFILIIGLLFYLLLTKLENLHIEMKEMEIILFFTFLVFWVNLLIYKNAFLEHGIVVIWQNMPGQLLSNTFDKITFLETFYTISIIPLILGVYAFYLVFYVEKSKEILLLVGFGMSSFLLLWFKLISLATGLVFLSVTLVILTSYSMRNLALFVDKTKIHRHKRLMFLILIVLFIVTAIMPSIIIGFEKSSITPTDDDVKVLIWSRDNIAENATIAATLEEGNMISYYTGKKNIMDDNFLLTPNIDQRLKELDEIFMTKFETEAVTNLNKYQATYIFFSEYTSKKYEVVKISYVNDYTCFAEIYYLNSTSIYNAKCKIK